MRHLGIFSILVLFGAYNCISHVRYNQQNKSTDDEILQKPSSLYSIIILQVTKTEEENTEGKVIHVVQTSMQFSITLNGLLN